MILTLKPHQMPDVNITIIGAGIIGLSIAAELSKNL
jgi:glycine/D-amino acid oxidase-like deaminating enzyme